MVGTLLPSVVGVEVGVGVVRRLVVVIAVVAVVLVVFVDARGEEKGLGEAVVAD